MYVLLPATLSSELYKMISSSLQNYTCQPTVLISMFTKQANVNMVIRSWQHYRRFLGAISFLYHHDNGSRKFSSGFAVRWGGGGGPSPTD